MKIQNFQPRVGSDLAPNVLNELFDQHDFRLIEEKTELNLPLCLLGLGRLNATPLHKWEEKRNDWAIHIVWQGRGLLFEAEKPCPVEAPCLMMLRPFVWYRQEVDSHNPWCSIYCFNRSSGLQTKKLFDQLGLNQTILPIKPESISLQNIWSSLHRAAKKGIDSSESVDGHFTEILDFLLALTKEVERDQEINTISNLSLRLPPDPDLLGAYHLSCNGPYMAKRLGLPIASLHRAFAKADLPTPAGWLRKVRLEKAHQLLNTKEPLRLSRVASACGFKNKKTLNLLFKSHYGISPKQMQIQFRKPKIK